MSQELQIVRGTTNNFNISLVDAEANPYVLTATEKLIFGVKSTPYSNTYIIKKVLTSADVVEGKYKFKLMPTDTINLNCGRYFYDLGLQSENDYYITIEMSTFDILQNITSMEGQNG